MIQVNVKCPRCGASLMDEGQPVDGYPGIRLVVEFGGTRTDLWLSSIFGSYNIHTGSPIAEETEVVMRCPQCSETLDSTRKYELCGARMARLLMREGGVIQICCRKGCRKHLVEFENLETEVAEFYRRHPIFWKAYHQPEDGDD